MAIFEKTTELIIGDDMNIETTTTGDLKTTLVGEVLFLGLLGKILYNEPNREILETLIADQVFTESPFGAEQSEIIRGLEILSRWSQKYANGIPDQDFAEIKADHAALLIGMDVFPTPPWESVYFNRERLVFQEQTLEVRKWYSRFGLQIEKLNSEPDDHIALELLFVAHLASQAAEQEDEHALEELLQAQRDFLSEHLLRWGPAWCRLVIKHASTDYFRGLAYLTHGALLAAAGFLQVKLPKEVSI